MFAQKKIFALEKRCAELEEALKRQRVLNAEFDLSCMGMCSTCTHGIKLSSPQTLTLDGFNGTYTIESSSWLCKLQVRQVCKHYTYKEDSVDK